MDLEGVVISPEAARTLLAFDFSAPDERRMAELSDLAGEGTLSAAERAELDEYVRAGHLLAVIHSKARVALARAGRS